ncbi:MAG: radical SAM family heme chaperone HemW [Gammaproteobacteria bacterium]|nr:radical SAM family heme chaperone HemW [Gammaproteobacteria bacterium]
MQKFNSPIPLSLYIHLPWCVRKCPYCDFNSHQAPDSLPEELYVNSLVKDLDEHLPQIWGRRLTSIFFGGGTPSLFSAKSIDNILREVQARLPFNSDLEITLEANPGTIDESRFKGFRDAGVNRLSLGLQSLQDDKLKALGRIHNREYALRAIEIAQQVGFDNINLDLMHGLPSQSVEDALADLRDALTWNTNHLSWYQLTIEPNTFFHHQPPTLPKENVLEDIQEQGKALLAQHGMHQYEVSAYSKSGRECAHNLNYWEFGDYLGIGAGAHSKLTDMDKQIITRHSQIKNPRDYLTPHQKFIAEQKNISAEDCAFEFMLNALRLNKGVPSNYFVERTGLELNYIQPIIQNAIEKKLLENNPNIICATELGQRFLNDLVAMFLSKV